MIVTVTTTPQPRQLYLEFDTTDSPAEQRRRARCQRLLASLGLPPEKIATGNTFDYDSATAIAAGRKNYQRLRGHRMPCNATQHRMAGEYPLGHATPQTANLGSSQRLLPEKRLRKYFHNQL